MNHLIPQSYLRDYGAMIGLPPDFLIWDEEEWWVEKSLFQFGANPYFWSQLVIRYILEKYKPGIKHETAVQFGQIISAAKSIPGQSPEELLYKRSPKSAHDWILKLYHDYLDVLRTSNALDFDDLLIKGLKVVEAVPWGQGVSRLQHLLVDELWAFLFFLFFLRLRLSERMEMDPKVRILVYISLKWFNDYARQLKTESA